MSDDFPTMWRETKAEVARAKAERAVRGDLYFISAGNAVKIGRTVNIVQRLGKMQSDNHERIDCLVLVRDGGRQEREYHERFAAHRLHGEWFARVPEIEAEITRLQGVSL